MPHENEPLAALMRRIESNEFAAYANVSSRLERVMAILRSSPEVGDLQRLCRESVQATNAVLNRLREIASFDVDERYESPWDVALAAYLLVLQSCDRRDETELGATLVRRAQQTWWGRRVADEVLKAQVREPAVVVDEVSLRVFGLRREVPIVREANPPELASDTFVVVNPLLMPTWPVCSATSRAAVGRLGLSGTGQMASAMAQVVATLLAEPVPLRTTSVQSVGESELVVDGAPA